MAAAIVVMGVSGSGKSTLGAALAARIGARFVDGDDLHPASNREKMAAGVPLNDDDRWPWLDLVATTLCEGSADGRGVVIACSALKRSYRERLRAAGPFVRFVYLAVDPVEVQGRLNAREGHFFPPHLLASQFAALEEPIGEPDVVTLRDAPLALQVDEALEGLGLSLGAERA